MPWTSSYLERDGMEQGCLMIWFCLRSSKEEKREKVAPERAVCFVKSDVKLRMDTPRIDRDSCSCSLTLACCWFWFSSKLCVDRFSCKKNTAAGTFFMRLQKRCMNSEKVPRIITRKKRETDPFWSSAGDPRASYQNLIRKKC